MGQAFGAIGMGLPKASNRPRLQKKTWENHVQILEIAPTLKKWNITPLCTACCSASRSCWVMSAEMTIPIRHFLLLGREDKYAPSKKQDRIGGLAERCAVSFPARNCSYIKKSAGYPLMKRILLPPIFIHRD